MKKIFTEKNIPKLIIITPIVTVLFTVVFVVYFFLKNQYDYFEVESHNIENNHILIQKQKMRQQINSAIDYIEFHKHTLTHKQLLKYIQSIRYGNDGYLWIHNDKYTLLTHPFRESSVGQNDANLTDVKGIFIIQKFVDESIQVREGVFIEYFWEKPLSKVAYKKYGFFKFIPELNWVIGTGLYLSDTKEEIEQNKNTLKQQIYGFIRKIVIISLLVLGVVTVLTFSVSNLTRQLFVNYQKKIKDKRNLLKQTNKKLEQKIKNAVEVAQSKDRMMLQQSRLANIGMILNMVAHQWRQPLNGVSSLLMELESNVKFKTIQKESIFATVQASNKLLDFMSNTIDDFIHFFKPDKKKSHFYLQDAIDEALSLLSASFEHTNIRLQKDLKINPLVYGYEREFEQVILNILSNARDALVQRNVPNPKIRVQASFADNETLVTISDNAGGIKEDDLEKIFEPYFTTKDASTFTGIGLYMAKIVIEQNMQGKLKASNDEKGAVFLIVLKKARDQEVPSAT